jgi:PhzF family phenazine biosynthesis protein
VVGGAEILRYAAFSVDGQGGNPAGIVLDARDLSAPEMVGIAAEVGYSETAFLTPRGGSVREYLARYYSPGGEIAFCGHATVACGIALAERYGQGRFTFDTRVGRVQAVASIAEPDGRHAILSGVGSHSRPASGTELDEVLDAIGWNRGDLDPRYPAHVLQPGNSHFLVPVREHETLKSLDYDYAALSAVMELRGWTTIHAVWAESPTVFRVRAPFPPGRLREDAGTGAGAVGLGTYLRDLGLVEVPAEVISNQGEEMGRPCRVIAVVPARGPVRLYGTGHEITDLSY